MSALGYLFERAIACFDWSALTGANLAPMIGAVLGATMQNEALFLLKPKMTTLFVREYLFGPPKRAQG